MSWNEPGSPKKDPWAGRDDQQSPPDLEEALRSLQERIGRLFGGKGGGGAGPASPMRTFGWLLLIAFGLWLLTGIYIVDEGNRGVVTRFGKYLETTMPGPHWHIPKPIESVTVVNVEQQRFVELGYRSGGRQPTLGAVPREAQMLTQDENIVDIRLAVQYQIKDAKDYLFNVQDPDLTLKQVTESAERGVIGKSTMDFVLTEGRSGVVGEMKEEIQQVLDQYRTGMRVVNVNLVDAQPPEEVQGAFEDAIKAREDEQRLKNEAEAYSNEVLPKARGAAARLLQEAEGYKQRVISRAQGEAGRFTQLLAEYEKSPDVTRERLYLDALQDIYGRSNLMMIDVKGSNNLLYLPLDRLKSRSAPSDVSKAAEHTPQATEVMDEAVKNLRATTRGREGRSP